MKFSVIITAYDQHDLTVVHVREAMNVSLLPDEIIVVNDGGTPDLRDRLKGIEKKCPLIYAQINQNIPWNYNGACNLGVWLSRGNNLVFEDNDNIPSFDFYQLALGILEGSPQVGRVTARARQVVPLAEILTKTKNEWIPTHSIGANQGTYMMRRSVYLDAKGQDERFCGEYGWMYYDWKRRLLNQVKTQFSSIGVYFYTQDGQSGLKRNMSVRNRHLLRRNTIEGIKQSPIGILNFTYNYEVL